MFIPKKEINYSKQNINTSDLKEIKKVLFSDYLTQGPKVQQFEKKINIYCKSKYSVACNSATSALHIACKAIGLKKNDLVWTNPISFVASANCALYCGAKVDYVDIDLDRFNITFENFKKKIEKAKKIKLPKLLIIVDYGGFPCDLDKIYKLAKKNKINVIQDSSHAFGAKYKKTKVGSCAYSDITVFSFHPVKIITTGEGGMAVCNNEEIHKKLSKLRSHGITKNKKKFQAPNNDPWYYEMQELGYNYRITDLSCALGISQLKRLDQIIKERNILYKYYESLLQDLPVRLLQIPNDVKSSVHLGIIRLNRNDKEFYRKVFNTFRKNNIGVQLHYNPVHLQPYYKKRGFKIGDFPISEKYSIDAISLPLFPQIKYNEIDRVIKCLKSALIDY